MASDASSEPELELLRTIASGRAVLLLGQRHTPGLIDELVRDIAALSGTEQRGSLHDQLQELATYSRIDQIRRAFTDHVPQDDLVELAGCPWSLAITSAIDPLPVEAFSRIGGGASRRLRIVYPSQSRSVSATVNPAALTMVRLFGSIDEQAVTNLPPLTAAALRQRQAFDASPVLQQLRYVAASGCLVVEGVGEDDWLPLDLLSLACESLPPQSVHWFLGRERPARPTDFPDFGESLVVHEGTLADMLKRWRPHPESAALAVAQDRLASPQDRIVTYDKNGKSHKIILSAQEWRSMTQTATILDDAVTATPPPLTPEEERAAFHRFLRSAQRPPDWSGVVRGFLFKRGVAEKFADAVVSAIRSLGAVNPSEATERYTVYYSRRPILLTGPPASGKSRLLHWLAVELRRRGYVVAYAMPTVGRLKVEALERVCRVLEEKGAPGIALLADDLDNSQYSHLAEALAAAGRNVVVVGSARFAPQAIEPDEDPRKALGKQADFTSHPVERELSAREIEAFRGYLEHHGEQTAGLTGKRMQEPYFLLLLYFLLPDTRGNVRLRLDSAYDRLANALDDTAHSAASVPNGRLQGQLRDIAEKLFPGFVPGTAEQSSPSPFEHSAITREALDLALICARLRRPVPVDHLLRAMGEEFLRSYPSFSRDLSESELLYEHIDDGGALVLNTDHAELARLVLESVRPMPAEQLKLMKWLIDAVRWSSLNFPGDDPDQDFCTELLQVVAPRGEFDDFYSSPDSLSEIAGLLRHVREDFQVFLPKLLHLEAQALRLLADRGGDYATSLGKLALAIEVLDQAETLLLERRSTETRNVELVNVLTTRAAVHGFVVGSHLTRLKQLNAEGSPQGEDARLKAEIELELEQVKQLVSRSRSVGRASFYSLDVSFWSHRDVLEQMPGLPESERTRLLSQLASVLETAIEEPLESSQVGKYRNRRIQLAELEKQFDVSTELAESMRASGDYTGWCQIIRARVYAPATRKARSPKAGAEGLDQLLSLDDGVWRSRDAMALAHRLWMEAHLPQGQVGGADPVMARCSREDWSLWSRVLRARRSFAEDEDNAFVVFCLAWSLFQLGEPKEALDQFAALEANTMGNRRRIGCLAVLTDEAGIPRQYRVIARRRQANVWICYAPQLLTEIRVPLSALGSEIDLQIGSEISIVAGLNYRGLLPWEQRPEPRPLSPERDAHGKAPNPPATREGRRPQSGPPTPAVMPRKHPGGGSR